MSLHRDIGHLQILNFKLKTRYFISSEDSHLYIYNTYQTPFLFRGDGAGFFIHSGTRVFA